MQQAAADADGQGSVTIIVQLEDSAGARSVSLFSRVMGTVNQDRNYFQNQIRDMVEQEQGRSRASACSACWAMAIPRRRDAARDAGDAGNPVQGSTTTTTPSTASPSRRRQPA